jgi:hypothetical protein
LRPKHQVWRVAINANSGTEREDAIRAATRWLGFQRVGRAIQDAFKSAINGAIRRGRLEKQGSQIRKSW